MTARWVAVGRLLVAHGLLFLLRFRAPEGSRLVVWICAAGTLRIDTRPLAAPPLRRWLIGADGSSAEEVTGR